jgi:hypothetical protein
MAAARPASIKMARGAAILKLPNRIAAHGPEATPSQTWRQVIHGPRCVFVAPLCYAAMRMAGTSPPTPMMNSSKMRKSSAEAESLSG